MPLRPEHCSVPCVEGRGTKMGIRYNFSRLNWEMEGAKKLNNAWDDFIHGMAK